MAPADGKKRENNYFDVGVQGRKTGITLEDRGIRDEYGMEPIDGVFSSPERSPPKRMARAGDRTLTSSEMELQGSATSQSFFELPSSLLTPAGSAPEPMEALSARRSLNANGKTSFPPPLGRSPIKTNLGSSPRRQSSMGPPSQARLAAQPSGRAASHPVVARRLDFSVDGTPPSLSSNGRKTALPGHNAHDDSIAEEEEEFPEDEDEQELPDADSDFAMNGMQEDSPEPANGEDSMQMLPEQDEVEELEEELLESVISPAPSNNKGKKAGKVAEVDEALDALEQELSSNEETPAVQPKKPVSRPKGNALLVSKTKKGQPAKSARGGKASQKVAPVDEEDESEVNEEEEAAPAPPKRRGRPAKAAAVQAEPDADEVDESTVNGDEELAPAPVKKRGPQPKAAAQPAPKPAKKKDSAKRSRQPEIHQDEEVEEESERPAKRAKKPPSKRDPNAKITSKADAGKPKTNQGKKAAPAATAKAASIGPGHVQGLQFLREATPFEEPGVRSTRSGRVSVKPMEFWKNERVKYGRDGTKDHIIRAEAIEQEKKERKRKVAGKRRRKTSEAMEEEPEFEQWEVDHGVISGFVNGWDGVAGAIVDEGQHQEDIAFSAAKIDTREVAGANFRYSKILGVPFFGAGMVDIPPEGAKRSKNSRRMHMAFCLLSGKVIVTVAEEEFTISKGGVWMVPRGNFYSIANEEQEPARIFFAQGCEMAAGSAEAQGEGETTQ